MCKILEQSQLFEALEENIPGIIYRFTIDSDKNFIFTYLSKSVKNIFGVDPESIINNPRSVIEYIDKNDLSGFLNSLKEATLNESVWEWKGKFVLKGETKFISTKAQPNITNTNKISWTGFFVNITEQELLKNKIKERENKLLESYKMSKSGCWEIYVQDGRLVWTEEIYKIFELPQNPGIDFTSFLKFIHNDDKKMVKDLFSDNTNGDNYKSVEYRIVLSNERIKYIYSTFKTIKDGSGEVYKYWGIVQDITDYKNKEKEVIKAKDQAEQATIAKSQFLSVMSHELRTPINAVIGVSHLMLQNNPRSDQMDNLNVLRFSSENLLVLVNDILDFSKIEAGKIEFEQVKFSFKELITNIKLALLPKAEEKGVSIDIHITDDIPDLLIGDPTRTYQIITNLVSNSVKFTEKGFVKISMSLNAFIGSFISINVGIEDSGIGIPQDKIESIFERFTQASFETNRKFGGTGLGLSITKKLLELQGSEIKVVSELDKGSKFFFRLNFKGCFEKEQLKENNSNLNKSLNGMRVLLVEDNKVNTMIVLQFFKKWGIIADTAENGLIAVQKVRLKDYDLILMDLQMPEMNGYEATIEIRKIPDLKYKKIPIIALTASVTVDIKEKTYESGMNDFIAKPFNPEELQRKLKIYYT